MSRWFRIYDDVLDDPKVQRLSGDLFKTWMNLLCLASKQGGILPPVDDIAFRLRISARDAQQRIEDLILAGLVDIRPDGKQEPHNWSSRQMPSDSSLARVRKHREKQRNADVTLQDRYSNGADSDPEEEIDNNPYTCTDAAREKGGVFNFASLGVGVGGRIVSPEAKLKVCQSLNLRECEPLVFAFLDWKPSRKARDLDAMFIKAAPRIFGRMTPDEQKRMLIPPEPEFTPPPIKPSASLLKAVSAAHGRR